MAEKHDGGGADESRERHGRRHRSIGGGGGRHGGRDRRQPRGRRTGGKRGKNAPRGSCEQHFLPPPSPPPRGSCEQHFPPWPAVNTPPDRTSTCYSTWGTPCAMVHAHCDPYSSSLDIQAHTAPLPCKDIITTCKDIITMTSPASAPAKDIVQLPHTNTPSPVAAHASWRRLLAIPSSRS